MSKRWRVYCTEPGHEGWRYVWTNTAPTECPGDPGYSINVDSIKQDMKEVPLYKIRPHTRKSRSKNLEEIAVSHFDPSGQHGDFRRVKFLGHLDEGATSYNFEVYDRTNEVSLSLTSFNNTGKESQEMTTDVISSVPTSETILQFNVERVGGNNKKYIWVEEISLIFGVPI